MGLFGLKIGWDVARAFLTEAASTALSPDTAGALATTMSVVLVIVLAFFFVFNSFDDTISLNDRQGLARKCTVD
jgi:hypothetical protein